MGCGGQKGSRRSSRKGLNTLTQNFRFCWFARYTFGTTEALVCGYLRGTRLKFEAHLEGDHPWAAIPAESYPH